MAAFYITDPGESSFRMMVRSLLVFVVAACSCSTARGFAAPHSKHAHLPPSSSSPMCLDMTTTTSSFFEHNAERCNELSRRAALVSAAALAAGTIATPAQAAALERKVQALERQNRATVNANGAPEKHLPNISVDGTSVTVVVPHVMDPEKPHYIEYVWLMDAATKTIVAVQAFQATDAAPPTISANVAAGTNLQALLYCNLHGLWRGDAFVV